MASHLFLAHLRTPGATWRTDVEGVGRKTATVIRRVLSSHEGG